MSEKSTSEFQIDTTLFKQFRGKVDSLYLFCTKPCNSRLFSSICDLYPPIPIQLVL